MPRLLSCFALIATALAATAPPPEARTPLGVFAQLGSFTDDILTWGDGRVLVAEQGSRDIFAFASDGTPLGRFPTRGSVPLVELADGRILVGGGRDITAHAPDGTLLGTFANQLNFPSSAFQFDDGRILVSETDKTGDPGDGRLSLFEPDGTRLPDFASNVKTPTAVMQLADGRVLVAEFFSQRISAFAPDGTSLGMFADLNGVQDMLQLPDGRVLAADLDHRDGGFGISTLSREGEYLGDFVDRGTRSVALTADGRLLVASGDAVYAYTVISVASEPEAPEASGVGAVFPQPLARGMEASVEVTPEAAGAVHLRVFDALGRVVAEARPLVLAGRQRLEVPTESLAPGVYVLRVEGAGLRASRRLVVAG